MKDSPVRWNKVYLMQDRTWWNLHKPNQICIVTNVSSLSVPLVHCVPLVTGILELSSAVVVQSVGESDSEQAENASAVCSTAFRPRLINCQVDLIFVLLKHHHFQMSNKLLGRFKSKGWPKKFQRFGTEMWTQNCELFM